MSRTSINNVAMILGLGVAMAVSSTARGNINLEWRPNSQIVQVNDIIRIGLYAVSDSASNQSLSAMDVVFGWQPGFMQLRGLDSAGGAPLLASVFPTVGSFGLNEANGASPYRPQDGDGLYRALASLGNPVNATPAGTLITTFLFDARNFTLNTTLQILPTGGTGGETIIYDGVTPNTDVTGTLGSANVTILPEPTMLGFVGLGGLFLIKRRRGCRA